MAYLGASLADGTVSSSITTLYSVPSTQTAIVRTFNVFNTGASSETVKFFVKRLGSTARQVGIAVLAQDESKQFIVDPLILSSEDAIQASTSGSVDYLITGAVQ